MMTDAPGAPDLARRLAEASAMVAALLAGEIDAIVDTESRTPLLLSKAQGALRESEERYRRIVETSNEGICTLDGGAHLTFVNGRFAELLGQPAAEMLGRSLFDFIGRSAGAPAALRAQLALEGIAEESEVEITLIGGATRWVLLKSVPIRDAHGRPVSVLVMLTDRTSHRSAEEALRKSEEQYRQIVEATSDGIVQLDHAGIIVFVNRRLADMLGYLPGEMIGASVFAFMNAAAAASVTAAFERRDGAATGTVDVTFVGKAGNELWANVAGSALLDAAGGHVGSLAIVRDFTEQRKLQSQLIVSDRLASVGTLAAGVAHEINNPLAAVTANLEFIADSLHRALSSDLDCGARSDAWLRESIKAPLDDARNATDRVRFIVRDLKILSSAPVAESRAVIDVRDALESALRMAWNEIRHHARVVRAYSAVPPVEVNEARLGQVFLNLLVNAAQAMQEGNADQNEIRVSTQRVGDHVVIEISDTGAGIAPEVIRRIFDPFFTTKAIGCGTGLGLAISMRIVTDLGGELSATSELGIGTTFRVALPVAAPAATSAMPSPAASPLASPTCGPRGRVLVVDDDEMVAAAIRRILAKEHDVVTVAQAQKALALCASGVAFDIILCDLMMPDMTGMDLHRELTRLVPEQAARMVFLTGGAFTETAQAFLAATDNEHVDKPFHVNGLRALVRRYRR